MTQRKLNPGVTFIYRLGMLSTLALIAVGGVPTAQAATPSRPTHSVEKGSSVAKVLVSAAMVGVMINIATRNTRANAITTALGASATVRAYNGTPPANPDTALSGNTLLAQGTYAATPYPGAANATMTSNAITGANAAASGTPTFYRTMATDGTTCVLQHNTTDFVVTPAALTSGVAVSWAAIVHTEALGT